MRRITGSNDDTEQFIELVRKFIYLYDPRHPMYKDLVNKTIAWNTIAEEMGTTSDVAKKRWKSLRDNYLRYKKCMKGFQGAVRYRKWPWSQQMQFLDDSLQPIIDGNTPNAEIDEMKGIEFLYNETPEPESGAEEHESSSTQMQPPQKKIKVEPETEFDSSLMTPEDKVLSYLQNTPARHEIDHIDHLFLSYSQTFRKFQPVTQALMKVELATLFAKMEMKELGTAFPSPGPSTS